MNFPQIIWPSLIKSIRNFILTTFIIKPYMDREFNLPDFVLGSKKAVEVKDSRVFDAVCVCVSFCFVFEGGFAENLAGGFEVVEGFGGG